jgi:hypothetical protein
LSALELAACLLRLAEQCWVLPAQHSKLRQARVLCLLSQTTTFKCKKFASHDKGPCFSAGGMTASGFSSCFGASVLSTTSSKALEDPTESKLVFKSTYRTTLFLQTEKPGNAFERGNLFIDTQTHTEKMNAQRTEPMVQSGHHISCKTKKGETNSSTINV